MHQNPTPITLRGYIKAQIICECVKVGRKETDSNRSHASCLKWGSAQAIYKWAASRECLGCQASQSHRLRVCIYSHHNSLSSQPGSSPHLYWSRSQSGSVSDFAGSSGPLQLLRLVLYSLSPLIWQPQSDFPFLFLNSARMLPPACQYLTTLSSYITSPALNPTPSIPKGCACSIQFNSTNLYWVLSIYSFLSTCIECVLHLALRIQKWKIWSLEFSWGGRHCGMSYDARAQPACRGVFHTRLAARRLSEWVQKIPKDNDSHLYWAKLDLGRHMDDKYMDSVLSELRFNTGRSPFYRLTGSLT